MKTFIHSRLVGSRVEQPLDHLEDNAYRDGPSLPPRHDDDLMESMYAPSTPHDSQGLVARWRDRPSQPVQARAMEEKWRQRLKLLGRTWGKFDRC